MSKILTDFVILKMRGIFSNAVCLTSGPRAGMTCASENLDLSSELIAAGAGKAMCINRLSRKASSNHSMSIRPLNDLSFNDAINSPIPTLVMFYATWCKMCNTSEPLLQEAHDKLKSDNIKCAFSKLDINENEITADRFEISYIPVFMLFSSGNLLGRYKGKRTVEKFYKFVKNDGRL